MNHTSGILAFGTLVLLTPLLSMAQDALRAREEALDMQNSVRLGERVQRGSSIFAPGRISPGTQKAGDTGAAPEPLGQSPADMDLTRQIRRSILGDEALSAYAHNVMIITRNGQVTLKGPVRSAQEKAVVEEIAASVVGKGNVKNEVDVSPRREP